MANVLIIDDDELMSRMLADLVSKLHHNADYSLTLKEGVEKAKAGSIDVIFLDVDLPDGNGLDKLEELKNIPTRPEIIIITGAGDPAGAEIAIKNGAWDYVQKPISPKEVFLPLKRVLQYRDNMKLSQKQAGLFQRENIIGNSQVLNATLQEALLASNIDANVLLSGETGTGKEIFAKAIHDNSRRRDGNFVVVDCASLPETLVESTLFGHVKGAFTGADRPHDGLIHMADRGTLFLDEVGELNKSLQKVFLRVLQEKRYRPVGGKEEIQVDFRLIAATNRDLERMVESKRYRVDLLHRIKSVSIHLPPLRDRKEDIKELVMWYMDRTCQSKGLPPKGFSPDFFDALSGHDWPGNIRELFNVLENSLNRANQEPILFPKHLPDYIRITWVKKSLLDDTRSDLELAFVSEQIPPLFDDDNTLPSYQQLRESVINDLEAFYFDRLMAVTDGSIKKACEIAGLGRTRLYTLLKKHDISRTTVDK